MNEKSLADIEQVNALEFSVDDTSNPRSVVSLTSEIPTLQKAMHDLIFMDPHLLEMDEHELKEKVKPSFTLSRIRMSFWNEYEKANQQNRKMHLAKIIAGICTETVFKKKLLSDHARLAYVLVPPKDYVITTKEALDAGLDNLRKIVTANVVDDEGNLIAKSADVVLKAIALLDMRVKGAVVQRIDQRSLNVNVNKDVTPQDSRPPQTLEELERQLEAVKHKLVRDVSQARLPSAPADIEATMKAIDVEVVDIGGNKKGG